MVTHLPLPDLSEDSPGQNQAEGPEPLEGVVLDAMIEAREERYGGTPAGWADFAGRTEARDLIRGAARTD